MGILTYFSKGSSSLSKERFEIHFDGKSILVDDYKTVRSFGIQHKRDYKVQQKGFYEILENLKDNLTNKNLDQTKILKEIFETTSITLSI